ncbi:hypothetical protein RB628_06030 [Streptomyces sp. ADMS]|uniref:hypothetical protein n=1 Tax=Streptomyces sp. ADMS TaxID=3071415 RepID=UPI00296F2C68|nr:hypothetical protein [Streptomyces sp. ADMS]MDW4904917.1 hypothetical protein [Streptomyces sp. ADMS]
MLGLGISADKVAGDFVFGLEDLRQRGVLPLEDMARVRATTEEHPVPWAAGFAAGYLSAWAAAVLLVLDTRGVAISKHFFRPLNLCTDAGTLTRLLEQAVTVAQGTDAFTGEFTEDPRSRRSHGS